MPSERAREGWETVLEVKASGEESSRLLGVAALPGRDLAAPREPQISTKPIAM